jgi:predicted secreted Zn-dependent protease
MALYRPLLCLFLSVPVPALAVELDETIVTYEVSELTADDLVVEMQAVGPHNYWAYTEWFVNWSAECDVSVSVIYTLPEHTAPEDMSADMQESWDAMLEALTSHEYQHGQHGIDAAEEIEAAGCENAHDIIAVWAQADKDFDAETNHGLNEGVGF